MINNENETFSPEMLKNELKRLLDLFDSGTLEDTDKQADWEMGILNYIQLAIDREILKNPDLVEKFKKISEEVNERKEIQSNSSVEDVVPTKEEKQKIYSLGKEILENLNG